MKEHFVLSCLTARKFDVSKLQNLRKTHEMLSGRGVCVKGCTQSVVFGDKCAADGVVLLKTALKWLETGSWLKR